MKKATLNETHPDLADQLVDKTLATVLTHGSGKKVEWQCDEDSSHVWVTSVCNRSRGSGCPYCSNRAVLPGYNDLQTVRPDLAAQLVDQDLATQLSEFSNKTVQWQCEENPLHVWDAMVASRSKGNGCPYCSNNKVLPGDNDLQTTHPDIAAQLVDPSLATTVVAGSGKVVLWRCDNNPAHTWETEIYVRTIMECGCPYCSNPPKAAFPGETDLGTTHPELAAQLVDPSLATELLPSSDRKVWWRCPDNPKHTWESSIYNRTGNESGCPYCAHYVPFPGETDLGTTHPELAAQLVDPSLAKTLAPQTVQKVWWQCGDNPKHQWEAQVANRVNGKGCPYCAPNGLAFVGESDLATTHEDLADELVDQELRTKLRAGSNLKVWWQCPNNPEHIYEQQVAHRTLQGTGCPSCADYGIDYQIPGYFYVVASEEIVKCGIANDHRIDARLEDHRKEFGLDQVLAKVYFDVTQDAKDVEDKWCEFVLASPYRIDNRREFVSYHDEAVSFALALARGDDLPDAA